MKKKVFAICDTEEAYALRLTEYILEKVRLPYMVHLFTQVEELQKFVQEEAVEILLIAESALRMLKEEYIRRQVAQMFVLQEGDVAGSGAAKHSIAGSSYLESEMAGDTAAKSDTGESDLLKRENQYYISKFQSPEKIVEMLAESIIGSSACALTMTVEETKVKLIGMYSPVKRCLQTSFALTMGQILAREHRTLYFNFENYSGFGQMLKREFPMDLMDLVYYFRSDKDKLSFKLPAIVQHMNGLDYIPPLQSHMGLREVTGGQWLELCSYIAGIGEYEYMILDLDDGMEGLFDLLQHCHKIYTVTRDDSFAAAKISQYEQMLRFNEMEDIADRTVKCRFPIFKELPANLELMTHGELAGYVKAIVREDLYGK